MRPLFLALSGLLFLTACETIGGAGRDIQTAGRYVQGTAQQVQNDF
ncbi:entericidin A/B family lipoprotein [Palleronia sp. LCG004]